MIRVKINIPTTQGALDYPFGPGALYGKVISPRRLLCDYPMFSNESLLVETHLEDLEPEDVLIFRGRPVEQEIQQVYSRSTVFA
jgi:hypothetical protein